MPWIRLAAASLLLLACQRVPLDYDPGPIDETDTDTDASTGDQPTTNPSADSSDEPMFGCEPGDKGTCPMGQKCTALSEGGLQNHFQCVNDDGEIPEGEQCGPAPGTGQDGCAAGTACLVTFPDADVGACIELCSNDADCEPGKCTVNPYGGTPFCADSCDPLFPECPQGRACLQAEDRFICAIAFQDVDVGVTGEECSAQSSSGCAEGYACMTGALVPGCNSSACCTNVCDLDVGDSQCTAPALCKNLFAEPAPGFEALGACYVPT